MDFVAEPSRLPPEIVTPFSVSVPCAGPLTTVAAPLERRIETRGRCRLDRHEDLARARETATLLGWTP